MTGETIKGRLAAGKITRVFALGQLASPKLIEIAALHGGYHGFWIDQEHAAVSHDRIEVLALACRATGLDAFVRVAPVDYATVMRPMEAGIRGIMAAQIRSLEQARQVVAWATYSPEGIRGVNISNFQGGWATRPLAQFLEQASRDRWLSIQIETLGALEEVEAIAQLEGVDNLFVGPADLSTSLGVPGEYLHPRCLAALERVARAVQGAGKSWGTVPRNREHADKCRELGCRLFALGADLSVVHQGFAAIRATFDSYFAED